jgi:hypothetical protein
VIKRVVSTWFRAASGEDLTQLQVTFYYNQNCNRNGMAVKFTTKIVAIFSRSKILLLEKII